MFDIEACSNLCLPFLEYYAAMGNEKKKQCIVECIITATLFLSFGPPSLSPLYQALEGNPSLGT